MNLNLVIELENVNAYNIIRTTAYALYSNSEF